MKFHKYLLNKVEHLYDYDFLKYVDGVLTKVVAVEEFRNVIPTLQEVAPNNWKEILDFLLDKRKELNGFSFADIWYKFPFEAEEWEFNFLSQHYDKFYWKKELDLDYKIDFVGETKNSTVLIQVKHSVFRHRTKEEALETYDRLAKQLQGKKMNHKYVWYSFISYFQYERKEILRKLIKWEE